jgi:Asp-tRNA(Asn)/Glu-tRNA(Gln) amidotransferase A subunit family amidase
MRTDADIERDVKEELKWDPDLDATDIAIGTGFPAVTFPGGFSTPTASAPIGVPVGAELLGLDYTEAKLLGYAYAFEQATRLRMLPKSTPPLPNEP